GGDAAGGACNAMIAVAPDGRLLFTYAKRHPWFVETWATPGDAPHPVVAIGDLRVTIAICFDVHFLAREAKDALAAADLLLFPSAWVEDAPEDETRVPILAEIARTFDVAVASANWAAGDVVAPGQGGSCILDR